MTDRILITGTAGFIGSHLAEKLLDEGHDVTGIDSFTDYYDIRIKKANLEPLLSRPRFRFVGESINTTDLEKLLEGVRVVFHLAAQAGVRASWGDEFDTYIDANVRATQRLCEATRGKSVHRFVYASSSSVYGETTELPMKETHPSHPVSPYGVTKLDGENLCLLYGRSYGLPVVCLRYFTVYGPRQRPDMAFHRFIRAALDGTPVEVYGNGEQTRDFTFVDDIISANLAAMDYAGDHRVFNVGGGSRVTLNSALDVIGTHARAEMDVRYVDRQRGDVTHTRADISLAARELAYEPRIGLEEGVEREVDWIRSTYRKLSDEESVA